MKGYDFNLSIRKNNSSKFWYMAFMQIPFDNGVLIFNNLSMFLLKEDGQNAFAKSLILSSGISANTFANLKDNPSF